MNGSFTLSRSAGLESEEVAVGVGDEELADFCLPVADGVLLCLRLHEQWVAGGSERVNDRLEVVHRDLEVDAAAEWPIERRGDPVTADPCLLEHHVGAAAGE